MTAAPLLPAVPAGRSAFDAFFEMSMSASRFDRRGNLADEVRKNIGAWLAREAPVEADYVVPVPDSGVPGSIGRARTRHSLQLGMIPFALCRTDLHPAQPGSPSPRREAEAQREQRAGRRQEHRRLNDHRCAVTSANLAQMMRDAGAREGHMRIRLRRRQGTAADGVEQRRSEREAARSTDGRRADARLYQRRQPRLRFRSRVSIARSARSAMARSRSAATPLHTCAYDHAYLMYRKRRRAAPLSSVASR